MRDIKFRGKDEQGVWRIGGFTLDAIGVPRITTTDVSGEGLLFHHVIPETVGQFTGLKDKNGVEVFEGDILKVTWTTASTGGYFQSSDAWCDNEVICVVQYVRDKFAYIGKDGKQVSFKTEATKEVIGLTHDNPELLK